MKEFIKKHPSLSKIIAVFLFIIVEILLWNKAINMFKGIGTAKTDGFYYIDTKGHMINLKGFLDEGSPFNEDGVAYAKGVPTSGKINGIDGFINKKGKVIRQAGITNFQIEGAFSFPIIITGSEKMEIVDKKLKAIKSKNHEYNYMMQCHSDFSNGPCLVDSGTGLLGYMNENLEWVIGPKFLTAGVFTEDKIAAVKDPATGLYGYIDTDGKYISDERFYRASAFSDGYALVQKEKDGGAAYINTKCEYITDFVFDYSLSQKGFSEGMAYVKFNDKLNFGYINEKGETVVEPKYHEVGSFSHGLAPVKYGHYSFIDKNGNVVIKNLFNWAGSFSKDGYAAVIMDGKYGIIDTNGDWLFEPQFAIERPMKWEDGFENMEPSTGFDVSAPDFQNGYCMVCLEKGQRVKRAKRK